MPENTSTSAPGPSQPTDLQQLEAALAAGAISPELFATLSAQLVPPTPPVAAAPVADELPSLLSMFDRPPASVAPLALPPAATTATVAQPAARPAVAGAAPSQQVADATRQQIEAQLARLRQPAPVAPPVSAAALVAPVPSPVPPMPAPPPRPAPPVVPALPVAPEPAAGSRWPAVLLIGAGIVLLGLLVYVFLRPAPANEALTSASLRTAAATTGSPAAPGSASRITPAATPTKRPKTKRAAAAKKGRVTAPAPPANPVRPYVATPAEAAQAAAVVVPASAVATSGPAAAALPAGTARPVAAAPEASDDAATIQVREVLAAYYADLFAPPLHASRYFAPQVERLYIQQNLTPAAIDAELARSFFPDNQQAVYQIEPGTLRVSPPAADGSRTATFTEAVRLYRVSRQKFQRLRTQVRVKLNTDFQLTYLRQEKLLANAFE